jgi:hypothetical protein
MIIRTFAKPVRYHSGHFSLKNKYYRPMKIYTKTGIDLLIFGMKQADVITIYGKPNKQFTDEDQNVIFVYNDQKFRLTFYKDEELKLGYIIAANDKLQINDSQIIGRFLDTVKSELLELKNWEIEEFDMIENHFNEENWIILVSEFGMITKIELGAIINEKDEFDWKF